MKLATDYTRNFFLLISLLACTIARSQDLTRFGFTAGFNTLQFDLPNQSQGYEFTPSLTFGIVLYTPVSESFGVKIPFLYQFKGITHHNIVEGSPASHYDAFPTLALQPQLHYNIVLHKQLPISFFAGGQAGLVLTDEFDYPTFDFAVLAGISIAVKTAGSKFYTLSIGYLVYPYTIHTKYLEVTDNTINWQGVELLLSYEF